MSWLARAHPAQLKLNVLLPSLQALFEKERGLQYLSTSSISLHVASSSEKSKYELSSFISQVRAVPPSPLCSSFPCESGSVVAAQSNILLHDLITARVSTTIPNLHEPQSSTNTPPPLDDSSPPPRPILRFPARTTRPHHRTAPASCPARARVAAGPFSFVATPPPPPPPPLHPPPPPPPPRALAHTHLRRESR